jgi:hypothetical protein
MISLLLEPVGENQLSMMVDAEINGRRGEDTAHFPTKPRGYGPDDESSPEPKGWAA